MANAMMLLVFCHSAPACRRTAFVCALWLEDEVRPDARAAVAELQRMGKRVVMIIGDARASRRSGGRELGLDEVMAEVLPERK